MRDINNNQKIARNRKAPLKGEKVESRLREQIPEALLRVLKEKNLGQLVVERWDQANSLRADQLERQRKLLLEVDEFVDPIYRAPQEWMSDLHLPMSYIICKTFHARMFAAILGDQEPFQVKAQKEANSERVAMVQDLMNYTIQRWANKYKGIEATIDDWLWSWITSGRGILKQRWHKEFSRFVDVEEFAVEGPATEIQGMIVPTIDKIEKAVKKDELVFEGPIWEHVLDEDIVIVGGNGDPDDADFVCEQLWMTPHELWSLADQNIFDKGAVKEILENSSEDKMSGEPTNQIKNQRAERAGEGGSVDDQYLVDRYQILEAYLKVDIDNSGIASDIVVWVHKTTREILRATYLYRIAKTGMKPYSVIDFHRRRGQQSAVGLIELIYPLSKEMDFMHNMKLDFGLLSTIPIGFYRASSSLSKERIPLTPGALIPLNDPIRDINFPQIGNRSSFAAGEEQALFQIISRVTGLSDMNFGSMAAQGATRTATGARVIANESNANLDVFLRRANRGFKKALTYLFQLLKENLPEGKEFRITGSDGNAYFRQVQSRDELAGMYDFDVTPNSAASNKQIVIESASQVLQLAQNPLLLQIGVVTPRNLFEAVKNYMQVLGIRDWSRYINPPPQGSRVFTPEELTNRILAGVDVVMTPDQDLEGFIAFAENFMNTDELLGQFNEQQVRVLAVKMQQAQQVLAALQQQQAQQANMMQMQNNAQAGTAIGQGMPTPEGMGGGEM